ncbi:hypothetical protein [Polyangium aurulentum]|uniref:hypothetical protein n=1 Tax=Polyangium aurulentum TaxID=2567896 RepID=UPI0010AE4A2B|nr:hypothetical protein [Polyangium aurulentum]UQA63225.1 hypothetical protein E8A73_023280 [Polyangium aurulentum]
MSAASSRRGRPGVVLVAAVLVCAARAAAQSTQVQPWRLDYTPGPDAPKNCPDKKYIQTALATKLKGHDPFTDDAPRSISVKLVPTPQRLEAHIEARDENGKVVATHVTHADSWRCDQLADRTVFYLRDIVDPIVLPLADVAPVNSSAPQAPSPVPSPPPPPRPHDRTPSSPATRAPSRSPLLPKLALSASAGATWWSAPETAMSLALGAEARWHRFSVGIEGHYDHAWDLPTRQDVAASQAGLVALACARRGFFSGRAFARACLFGNVAVLSIGSDKAEFEDPFDDDELVLDLGARLGGGFWLARFLGLELHGDVAYVPRRPVFMVDGEQIWRAPSFTGALRLGLVLPFDIR